MRISDLIDNNDPDKLDENLRSWFKDKWVRFGPDGKIRGDCARGDDSEGKPKCLPQSKAQALGKKKRAAAAAKKRREDPNPERRGAAKNVATKVREEQIDEKCWDGYHKEGNKKMFGKTVPNCVKNEDVAEGSENNRISFQVQKGKNKFATTLSIGNNPVGVYQYDANTGRSIAEVYPEFKGKGLGKLLVLHAIYTAAKLGLDFQEDESRTSEYDNVLDSLSSNGYIVDDDGYWYVTGEGEQFLKQSLKQGVAESSIPFDQCPHCRDPIVHESQLNEKKDACYHKVKSRYKVWPSAYASGALVQCRKKGAANWGNKS